ncbi:DUF3859 domain-containing protein [Coraliomargarita akajimensis]|uniref:DUF3859 domain-containing protein n=1 Tax=Coraliomargarita akajimensis (strain DSM 45221 / IAM 15411 / JCM 23193 / KCTC 12865 / 04OKA010-24) TaxID=583355 RepID=D5ENS6_CORAD|nr:DUF3859 domain-containing protein [Coraliomargarita akajimensis]ADE53585.1 hypothetical protein Caka_0560 [Coraliomargarita akajimensis DSM 45221]
MKLFVHSLLACLLGLGSLQAEGTPAPALIELTGFGIITPETETGGKDIPIDNETEVDLSFIKLPRIKVSSSDIALERPLTFGITYTKLTAEPITLKYYLTAPGVITAPDAEKPMNQFIITQKIYDDHNVFAYTIEDEWEAVEGIWHFQVVHDGKLLIHQKFNLQKPSPKDADGSTAGTEQP